MKWPRLLRTLIVALYLALLPGLSPAQSPQEIRQLADFTGQANILVQEVIAQSNALSTADTRLLDAMDGYGDLTVEEARKEAEAVLADADAGFSILEDATAGLVPPDLETERIVRIVEAAKGIPSEALSSLRIDIETLRRRIEVSFDPDAVQNAELDRIWGTNARRYVEVENQFLEISLETIDPRHPQYGLSESYLLTNRALGPLLNMMAEDAYTDTGIADAITALRENAAEASVAIARSRRAMLPWYVEGIRTPFIRSLIPLYRESHETELKIASTLQRLADAMETAEDYDPAVYMRMETDLQSLIEDRFTEQVSRLSIIQEALRQ